MEPITSLQNDKVKLAHGLQNRARTRRKERKIALEGVRLVRDAVERRHRPLFVLYQPENTDESLMNLLANSNTTLIPVSDEVMQHVSDTQTPQGVLGVFPLPKPHIPKHLRRVLILDNVRDPGNMGTMLRTAAAAGVQVVLLSPGCTDPYNPKALRSGMGAHFRVPVLEGEWHEIATACEGINVYLTSGTGEVAYTDVAWKDPWAVIVGSEAHGAGRHAGEIASARITIPMWSETESLNAAVAAGVVLFEAARHRNNHNT